MKQGKIINDPVYGFIRIPSQLIFNLIEHPYFQRLRYIKQLGMTHLVYPGALHTRFQHTLGAMHLMQASVETLRAKGHTISQEEEEGVTIAILLHDIGHGPFSHALEHSLVQDIVHENVSEWFMQKLNQEFNNQLSTAIAIFNNTYSKKFLHQLVSSQLDLDRLDYLNRDSFFTGVAEGVVGFDRIIAMLNVKNDELVVEEKGIYSVEKFLIARRLMYWQVYFHKTVIVAEQMLVKILKRAKHLASSAETLFATPSLHHFLYHQWSYRDFELDATHLEHFAKLDDNDIFTSIKVWTTHPDKILAYLCKSLLERNLYRIEITSKGSFDTSMEQLKTNAHKLFPFINNEQDLAYFVFADVIKNKAYQLGDGSIKILKKDGTLVDIANASDNENLETLSKTVEKQFLCYAKSLNR